MTQVKAASGNKHDSLARRSASAAVGIPILLLSIWAGGVWFIAVVVLAALLGVVELYRLGEVRNLWLQRIPGLALTLLLVLDGYLLFIVVMPFFVVGGLLALGLYLWRVPSRLRSWLLTLTGPLYLGATLAYALLLRQVPQGVRWVTLALLAVFAVDTSAYLIGRAVGRHRMAPKISPGKTWEGAAAGLVGGIGATLLLSRLLALPLSVTEATALGMAVAIVAQAGDLLESAVKRAAKAKESGWIIPGHGGMLDRLDSVVFTLVLVYYVAVGRVA
ncbi:MAG: phosphatidate cytidylyltransferase [Chloroflexi bacterium]|nr:phosphatidate cytidylyltransferase [Chloroflexota bacterium]